MDHEVWSHQNQNSHKFSSSSSSTTISTELSLISSSFQSTSKHGNGDLISRAHDYSSTFNSMRNNDNNNNNNTNRMKIWRPSGRNLKKTCINNNNNNNINKEGHHQYWSCSTSLELYDNPWKIKKALTTSDLGKLNRLLFGGELLENLMLPVLDADAQRDAESGMGTPIRVWDVDTMSMHLLILKRWASFKNYVLIGKWNQDFVRRRELKKGDEIGLQWDSYRHCFNFSVLKRFHQC